MWAKPEIEECQYDSYNQLKKHAEHLKRPAYGRKLMFIRKQSCRQYGMQTMIQ